MHENVIMPRDEHNEELVSNVSPPSWVNPDPAPVYNLVVLGAGTAGLICASAAAGLGAKVALIEKYFMGGDCLNVGCVPSKTLIHSARMIKQFQAMSQKITPEKPLSFPPFKDVMERMRRIRSRISINDSAQRYQSMGIDVFFANARFLDKHTVEVDGKALKFKKAVIATGARAGTPPIPGLQSIPYLTNETLFNLTELPPRLCIIGGGPIGCEMAQAFVRFGSKVTIVEIAPQILGREDSDAAKIIQSKLEEEGVHIFTGCKNLSVSASDNQTHIVFEHRGENKNLETDVVLVSAGRIPNVDDLNLEKAGVAFSLTQGVLTNDYLKTSNPDIFAAGDVCLPWKFTHTAEASAKIVVQNALFFGRKKWSHLVLPWCTYTDPEVAHVGMYENEAQSKGIPVNTFIQPLSEIDRAITEGEELGFIKFIVQKGSDKILGATIVASHAGELISEVTLAIQNGIGLGKIANTIHPYPTVAQGIQRVAYLYNRSRLKPSLQNILKKWFEWKRQKFL